MRFTDTGHSIPGIPETPSNQRNFTEAQVVFEARHEAALTVDVLRRANGRRNPITLLVEGQLDQFDRPDARPVSFKNEIARQIQLRLGEAAVDGLTNAAGDHVSLSSDLVSAAQELWAAVKPVEQVGGGALLPPDWDYNDLYHAGTPRGRISQDGASELVATGELVRVGHHD